MHLACTRVLRPASSTRRRPSIRKSGCLAVAQTVDGKSIMGVLLLAAARGTVLEITADGPDEAEAVAALVQLIESGLGE